MRPGVAFQARPRPWKKRGYYVEAVLQFEGFAKKNPADAFAPEALYDIAGYIRRIMKLYSAAVRYFAMVLDKYPQAAPWNRLAAVGMLNSPIIFRSNPVIFG